MQIYGKFSEHQQILLIDLYFLLELHGQYRILTGLQAFDHNRYSSCKQSPH